VGAKGISSDSREGRSWKLLYLEVAERPDNQSVLIALFMMSAIGSAIMLKFPQDDFLPKVEWRDINAVEPRVIIVLKVCWMFRRSRLNTPSTSNF